MSGIAVFLAAVLAAIIVFGVGAGAQEDAPGVATRAITIVHRPPDELVAPTIIDQLEPTTVLTIRAALFDKNITGKVSQCTVGERRLCRNSVPVRFDGAGAADFQYLITDGGGCRLVDDRCTIEIRAGQTMSVVDTVFVDVAPPPGHITVTPRHDLLVGDNVTVTAEGFPSSATLTLMICAAPSTIFVPRSVRRKSPVPRWSSSAGCSPPTALPTARSTTPPTPTSCAPGGPVRPRRAPPRRWQPGRHRVAAGAGS